jgi:hypothetical protein
LQKEEKRSAEKLLGCWDEGDHLYAIRINGGEVVQQLLTLLLNYLKGAFCSGVKAHGKKS